MLKGINKIMIEGFVGRDPELRTLPTRTVCCTLSIGTTRIWRDRVSSEQKSHTEWHKVVCWNSTAKWASEKIRKGMLVYAEGDMRYRSYTRGDDDIWVAELFAVDVSVRNWESTADRAAKGQAGERDPMAPTTPMPADDIPF